MSQQSTPRQNETGIFANLTIPERNGAAKEMSAETAIPVAALAPPIPQAILAEQPGREAISLDIERKPESKGSFSLPHPFLWRHWLIFWFCSATIVTLTGLALGAGPCFVAVLVFSGGAFIIKSIVVVHFLKCPSRPRQLWSFFAKTGAAAKEAFR